MSDESSTTPRPSGDTQTGTSRDCLEALLAEQTRRWRSGEGQPVEALVAGRVDVDDAGLMDLIYNEIVLREQGQDKPSLEEFLQRFHDLHQIKLQFELDHLLWASRSSARHDSGCSEYRGG